VTTRRDFLQAAAVPLLASPLSAAEVPPYLSDYASLYGREPHQAAIEWFKNAKRGLFLHYGLYSLLGGEYQGREVRHLFNPDNPVAEWIQFHGKIPVGEYAKLKEDFTAAKFDADFITDLALAADMKYVNITTRHHDSFCLFKTNETDFHSLNSPAKRDLVAELAEQCSKKKLGLFLYYSHARDWKHPHAPTNEWSRTCRPHYAKPQPEYVPDDEVVISKYVEFMDRQITELLTQYGPVAGIWLDGEGVPKSYAKKLEGGLKEAVNILQVNQLYAKIRKLQPQCLISYKKGLTGTEDFLTPERKTFGLNASDKPLEINTTLQAHSWGYNKYTKHRKTPAEIQKLLDMAAKVPANVCLNSGPMGDGSIVKEEADTLRALGA
jgi:alpha-L-fucosidase